MCATGLNFYNYLNVVSYVLNYAFVNEGLLKILGIPAIPEVSARYQTLVTPAGPFFSIWAIIYLSQAVFTIAQLFPAFSSHPQVQDGVRYWYGFICLVQILWTFIFGFELIWLSCVDMLLILFGLWSLLWSQDISISDGTSKEFWLLRFPFHCHAGWITAASVVNVNIVFVAGGASASVQVGAAILSLLTLLGVALYILFSQPKLKLVVPLVLAWAVGGIWVELNNPSPSVVDRFHDKTIHGLKVGACCTCVIIVVSSLIKLLLYLKKRAHGDSAGEETTLLNPEGAPTYT